MHDFGRERNHKELFYLNIGRLGNFIEVTPALRAQLGGQRKTALNLPRGAGCIPKQDRMQA